MLPQHKCCLQTKPAMNAKTKFSFCYLSLDISSILSGRTSSPSLDYLRRGIANGPVKTGRKTIPPSQHFLRGKPIRKHHISPTSNLGMSIQMTLQHFQGRWPQHVHLLVEGSFPQEKNTTQKRQSRPLLPYLMHGMVFLTRWTWRDVWSWQEGSTASGVIKHRWEIREKWRFECDNKDSDSA